MRTRTAPSPARWARRSIQVELWRGIVKEWPKTTIGARTCPQISSFSVAVRHCREAKTCDSARRPHSRSDQPEIRVRSPTGGPGLAARRTKPGRRRRPEGPARRAGARVERSARQEDPVRVPRGPEDRGRQRDDRRALQRPASRRDLRLMASRPMQRLGPRAWRRRVVGRRDGRVRSRHRGDHGARRGSRQAAQRTTRARRSRSAGGACAFRARRRPDRRSAGRLRMKSRGKRRARQASMRDAIEPRGARGHDRALSRRGRRRGFQAPGASERSARRHGAAARGRLRGRNSSGMA